MDHQQQPARSICTEVEAHRPQERAGTQVQASLRPRCVDLEGGALLALGHLAQVHLPQPNSPRPQAPACSCVRARPLDALKRSRSASWCCATASSAPESRTGSSAAATSSSNDWLKWCGARAGPWSKNHRCSGVSGAQPGDRPLLRLDGPRLTYLRRQLRDSGLGAGTTAWASVEALPGEHG